MKAGKSADASLDYTLKRVVPLVRRNPEPLSLIVVIDDKSDWVPAIFYPCTTGMQIRHGLWLPRSGRKHGARQ